MSLLAVATTLAAVLSVSQPAQARDARPAADDLPLQVTITGLNPSVVPREGPLQVSGTVSNTGDQTYDAIRLYGLTSTVPITSRFELATAAASDPAVEVGNRILDAFDSIDSLAPGESAPYSIRIPRRLLPIDAETSAPGVYWLGVHALGETSLAFLTDPTWSPTARRGHSSRSCTPDRVDSTPRWSCRCATPCATGPTARSGG